MRTLLSCCVLFAIALLLIHAPAIAQVPGAASDQITRAMNTLERFAYGNFERNTGGNIPLMPMQKPQTVGERFLNRSWNKTSFLLYNASDFSEAYQAKYDLLDREMVVYFPTGLKVIRTENIKSFIWVDSVSARSGLFVNGREFTDAEDQVPFVGFFQVLSEGQLTLLKKTEASVQENNYNVALNVGRRDNQIRHKVAYFYALPDGTLHSLPKRREKLRQIFTGHEEEMERFIRLNQVNPEKEHHLEVLFGHYNALGQEP